MRCNTPLKAFRLPFGGVTFKRSDGTVPVELPCGNCMACRINHIREWAVRAEHEMRLHEENAFVTLTYDPEHLPKDLSLDHEHFQLFMKKLRKYTNQKIRFLMCGEYGEQKARPHYHAIFFGYMPTDLELIREKPFKMYTSEFLAQTWGKGFVTVSEANYETATYVAGYVRKKIKGKAQHEINENGLRPYELYDEESGEIIDRKSEYAQMSRRPGIGAEFYAKHKKAILDHDFTVANHKRVPTPAYYDRLSRREHLDIYERTKRERWAKAQENPPPPEARRADKERYLQTITRKSKESRL